MAAASTMAAIAGTALLVNQVESANHQRRLAGQERNRQRDAVNEAEKKKKTSEDRLSREKMSAARRALQSSGGNSTQGRAGTILTQGPNASANSNTLGHITGTNTLLGQ